MRFLARKLSLLLAGIAYLVPYPVFKLKAYCLAFLWCKILRLRKSVVFSNIELAFPNTSTVIKEKWYFESIYILALSFYEVLLVPHLLTKKLDQLFVFHGLENVPQDKACFFLTLHMGSGDLAAAVISEKIKPLSLISKRFKNTFFDELWFSLRTRSKTQFIDAHSQQNAFEILKALKLNRAVVFVIDQFMGKPFGVETTFFGHSTGTAYGLALFALKTKAPVVPLYVYWGQDRRIHIVFEKPVDFSEIQENDKEVAKQLITQKFNHVLENIIRQHPSQWMWVHRRWKVFE